MSEKLTEESIIYIASKMAEKGLTDYEDVEYSDDLYDHEDQVKDVMDYINEYINIGRIEFYEKYEEKGYQLY